MPPVRQSVIRNLKGWQPVQNPIASPVKSAPPTLPNVPSRSPFMHASMPLVASTLDSFTRQFYNGSTVPQTRILPAGNQR
jgi:hypothetical protein